MIDHYKILGITETATKDEIKKAFRNLAVKFHPDKHSHSPKPIKDDAILKFKQVSEAYQILSDDRKRNEYNLRFRHRSGGGGYYGGSGGAYGYGYHGRRGESGNSGFRRSDGVVWKVERLVRFMTTRAFLLNLAFAGVLLGASVVIDSSGEALWKMHNSGKSFEEALESIEKAKSHKDKT